MRHLALFGLFVLLAACEQNAPGENPAGSDAIDGIDMIRHVGVLAADDMGGRAPGSPAEDKVIEYVTSQFVEAGLQPGNGDSWTQEVPLVKITASPDMVMTVAPREEGEDQAVMQLAYGEDMMAFTRRLQPEIAIEDSPLVFAGYGIVAPEYDWNDYEGLDVEGKTVVVFVNDPGFATQNPELFTGNAMTYYGRWSYKYEEAARQGATGVIIVHETDAAGYPWEVVSGSWSGPQFDLAGGGEEYRLPLRAWITNDVAQQLFAANGMSIDEARQLALQPDFQAQPLDQTVSITINNTIEEITSHNILGKLPGDARPNETVIYTAHWDHLGTNPANTEDPVFNGAVDNATGVAGLIELAEAFGTLESPPDRTILFLAVTAEESGLLGSKWYAEHPVFPLETTAGVINMDSLNVYGPTKDVVVVGYGNSELEEYLARAAAEQGREIVPEEHPERGYYYRSDHFNFAKQGVPALYAESGSQYTGEGAEEAARHAAEYTEKRYHKPSDEYAEWWNLEGAVEDLKLYFAIGKELANTEDFPNWYEGNEFKAIREESAAMRQEQ
ncbi:MAG TPA: M28 family metallopeptidase [Gammaproteobacteria bacterium]